MSNMSNINEDENNMTCSTEYTIINYMAENYDNTLNDRPKHCNKLEL